MELEAPTGDRAGPVTPKRWSACSGTRSRGRSPGTGQGSSYSNALHLRTGHDDADEDSPNHRLGWYGCSCCPPNLARLMASIQAYLLTRDASGLQVHMPFSGTVSTKRPKVGPWSSRLQTGHPWSGDTDIEGDAMQFYRALGTCRCASPIGPARKARE